MVVLATLLVGGAGLHAFACASLDSTKPEAGTTQQRLDLSVSTDVALGGGLSGQDDGSQWGAAIVGAAGQHLAAWRDYRLDIDGSLSRYYAGRLNDDGDLLDPPGVPLTTQLVKGEGMLEIAAAPTGYLAVLANVDLSGVWIDRQGNVSASKTLVGAKPTETFPFVKATFDGTRFIVAATRQWPIDAGYEEPSTQAVTELYAIDPESLDVSQTKSPAVSPARVTSNGHAAFGVRCNSETVTVVPLSDNGALTATSPISVPAPGANQDAQLVWANDSFFLARMASDSNDIFSMRVLAQRLSPTGLPLGAEVLVAEWQGKSGVGPSLEAAFVDDHLVVAWFPNDGATVPSVHMRELSPALELGQESIAPGPSYRLALSPSASGGAVALRQVASTVRVSTYGGGVLLPDRALVSTIPAQDETVVATTDGGFLAAFVERASSASAISLAGIQASSTVPVATYIGALATLTPDARAESPALAASTDQVLVAWAERTDPPRVEAARATFDGKILDAPPLHIATEDSGAGGNVDATAVSAAALADGYVIAYQFARFNTVGPFSPSVCTIAVAHDGGVGSPHCLAGERPTLAVTSSGPVLAFSQWDDAGGGDWLVRAARIEQDGQPGPAATLSGSNGFFPALAERNGRVLAVWQHWANAVTELRACMLDLDSLSPLSADWTIASTTAGYLHPTATTFADGFAAAWNENGRLHGVLLDSNGQPVAAPVELPDDARLPSLASTGGSTLLVYPKLDPASGALRGVARKLMVSAALDAGEDVTADSGDGASADSTAPKASAVHAVGGCTQTRGHGSGNATLVSLIGALWAVSQRRRRVRHSCRRAEHRTGPATP